MARDFRIVEPIGHSTSLFGRAMTRERDARIRRADLEMRQQREARRQQSFVQGAPIREYQTNKAIADSSMLRSQVQAANAFEKNRPQHQQTFTKLMDPNQWIKTDGTRDHEGWRNAALEFSTNISSAIEYSTDAESMANVLLPEITRQAAVTAQIENDQIKKIQKAEALAEVEQRRKAREREDKDEQHRVIDSSNLTPERRETAHTQIELGQSVTGLGVKKEAKLPFSSMNLETNAEDVQIASVEIQEGILQLVGGESAEIEVGEVNDLNINPVAQKIALFEQRTGRKYPIDEVINKINFKGTGDDELAEEAKLSSTLRAKIDRIKSKELVADSNEGRSTEPSSIPSDPTADDIFNSPL